MNRLIGVFILFKTLAPVILVVAGALTINNIFGDLQAAINPPLQVINQRAESLQQNFETAQTQFATLSTRINQVVSRVSDLPNLIPTIPGNFTMPSISIPAPNSLTVPTVSWTSVTLRYPSGIDFDLVTILGFLNVPTGFSVTWSTRSIPTLTASTTTVPISIPSIPSFTVNLPGLDLVRSAVNFLRTTFDRVSNAFDSLNVLGSTLEGMGEDFNAIVSQTSTVLVNMRDTGARWAGQVALLLLATVVILGIIFALTILNNLRIGLHMILTGQRPPA